MEDLIAQFNFYLQGEPFLAVLTSFLAGVLASFTPCVYPLIPITVGFIGAKSAASRARGFYLSLLYVLGLATVYSSLGAFAALSGRLFGQINTSPWTYFFVGNVCLFFGLAMLDVFTIQIRGISFLQPSLKPSRGGFSAFLFGGFSAFVAGPCTTPVLGALLTYVASRQNIFLGVLMLFTFALGMGLLLILVGTFTGILSSLPSSGNWMVRIKKSFGFLMIIIGEYFFVKAGQFML